MVDDAEEPERVTEAPPASNAAPDAGASAPNSSTSELVTYRELLSNRNFRLLWLGEALSTLGSYFTRIAIPIYVFQVTRSYTQLGFAAFASLLASLVFGLIAGGLADRWNRRRILIGADWTSAGLMILLTALVTLPLAAPWKLMALYLMSFALGILREMFGAARLAIFPDVLNDSELLAANSLDQGTTTLAELLSYPLAAAMLFRWGPAVAFGADALTFVVSALLLAGVRIPPSTTQPPPAQPLWREIMAGFQLIRRLPLVARIALLSLIVPVAISLLNTLALPYAVDVLGSTEEVGFPALEGAMALGFTLGVLALGRWGQRASRAVLLGYGLAGYGFTYVLLGLFPIVAGASAGVPASARPTHWTPLLLGALPLMMVAGGLNSLVPVGIRTVMQEQTPREALGRVAGVVQVASGIGFSAGALLTSISQGRVTYVVALVGATLVALGIFVRRWLRTA